MTCDRCNVPFETEELEVGECQTCRRVSKIMVYVMSRWALSELEELSKLLKSGYVDAMIKDYDQKRAHAMLRLCRLIRHLGSTIPSGPEHLKGRVCDGIHKRIKSEEANGKWARENGLTIEQLSKLQAKSIQKSLQEAVIR